jgi:CRISPR-associated endonuclease/helicase Cas3
MRSSFYAHSLEGCPPSQWHPLEDHLRAVGALAARFAEVFGASDAARLAGAWHDLGKYSRAFQAYIRGGDGEAAHLEGQRGKVNHSSAGAVRAAEFFGKTNPVAARVLAYCIAGHHAGLPDWHTNSDGCLKSRLARGEPETLEALSRVPQPDVNSPALPRLVPGDRKSDIGFQAGMLTRMLFSCLTDADFLDTEAFMNPQRSSGRQEVAVTLDELERALHRHLDEISLHAERTPVNERRREVLKACLAAADGNPGFFSLTVPTGGGKTLSSLAFALAHARKHNLRRVIYAVPFTSIIEQNADAFRKALGEFGGAVVEHHSNLDPLKETPWNRLACENWDAPLVVTTNVQFFESLFTARSSACRKLHNVARSVIILDEAQVLPVEFLTPCLAALKELVRNYGCTVVLCTATQPAVNRRESFPIGVDRPREIVPDPRSLYEQMRRVRVQRADKLDDEELSRQLTDEAQVLCVVNTKAHAARLYDKIRSGCEAYHLSAFMCPQHRSEVIATIKARLHDELPCRVVSTQLIEAGVDIDFPVVYRAMCGLDSIAQAAGRCNREGKLDVGRVFVFDADQPPPPGHLRQTAETAAELVGLYDDLLSPEAIERFFRLHYWKRNDLWDHHGIMGCFGLSGIGKPLCDFRTAAEKFRLIPEVTKPVIIPWGTQGEELVAQLRADPFPGRDIRRALQRYTVSVHEQHWKRLEEAGCLDPVKEQYPVLLNMELYDSDTGLSLPDGLMIC